MKATIQKREGKRGTSYRVLIRRTGHPAESATFASKKLAEIHARTRLGEIDHDRANRISPTVSIGRRRAISALLPDYLAYLEKNESRRTLPEIKAKLEFWSALLPKMPISDITDTTVRDLRDKLLETRSDATVNRYVAALSGMLSWCLYTKHYLTSHPIRGYIKPIKEPKHRVRCLSDTERAQLFDACKAQTQSPALYPLAVVACYSGMRQGELLALTWNDVNLTEGLASVNDSKNGEPRTVPVTGFALNTLKDWHRTTGTRFAGSAGDRVFGLVAFPAKSWRAALASIEPRLPNFSRFHDLRHCAASYLIKSKAGIAVVAEILGHKSIAMSIKYAHLDTDALTEASERAGEKFK